MTVSPSSSVRVLFGLLLSLATLAGRGSAAAPLTLVEARATALRKHPRISVADLKALAARQVVREVEAARLPTVSASVVAVGADDDTTRLAAVGGMNNPSVFDRLAGGLNVSQLLTDFGRTSRLRGAARLRAEAEESAAQATREQVLLQVDSAYFSVLREEAISRVARRTLEARAVFLEQVRALAEQHLRSDLDVSFAQVHRDEAGLLLTRATNEVESARATLDALLGEREARPWELADVPLPSEPTEDVDALVTKALVWRPDLARLRREREAAGAYADAERALRYPTVAAVGSAGVVPIGDDRLPDSYAAAGVTVNIPLYTGGLIASRGREAELRARAAGENVRDEENAVVRDVRVTWARLRSSRERLRLTEELARHAALALELARARYDVGASSIVELENAQVNQVSAEIAVSNTRYEYLLQRSLLDFQTGSLR